MDEENKKLYVKIADKLMEQIQAGQYQVGDRLPAERTLATEFQVSRSVIREAIRSMQQMGCIESKVGGGNFVKALEVSDLTESLSMFFSQDNEFAIELVETRLILEPQVARLAALRRNEEELREMWKTLKEMQAEIKKGGKGVEGDLKFHTQLANATWNRSLRAVCASCYEALSRSLEVTQALSGVSREALVDHERILSAITNQDEEAAEFYMRTHLISTYENLRKVAERGVSGTV